MESLVFFATGAQRELTSDLSVHPSLGGYTNAGFLLMFCLSRPAIVSLALSLVGIKVCD